MTVNHRKKMTRMRAKTTHGYGSMKKNRGAGNRGGRGNAGSGKRGDSNKQRFQGDKKYFGKHGFTSKKFKETITAINITDINVKIDRMILDNTVKKDGDKYPIDLKTLKVNKLLAKGSPKYAYDIKVKYATSKAVAKVTEKGGLVTTENKEA